MDKWQHSGPPTGLERFYRKHSRQVLTSRGLRQQSRAYRGTGGSSEETRSRGFSPAFIDTQTGVIYPSRFSDGRPAPVHMLDGFPAELVVRRNRAGRVTAVKGSIVAGFARRGRFYSREEAARCLDEGERGSEDEGRPSPPRLYAS